MRIPITTSALVDTPFRRVVDLTDEGVPEIPVLGFNRSIRTTEGSVFHRHRSLEITYCERGSVKFDCGRRACALVPGCVFISCPEDVHRLRVNPKGAVLYWMFLRLPRRGEGFLGLDGREAAWLVRKLKAVSRKAVSVPADVGSCYRRLFQLLEDETSGSLMRRMKLRTTVVTLLLSLSEAGSPVAEDLRDLRFQTLVDRMRREPKKAFSMDEVSAELRCSPNVVRAQFKKYTGVSPQSFMMKCRIRRAQDLLRDGKTSVTEIACSLGFSSSQNFAIRFRQETGRSPTEWRTECAANVANSRLRRSQSRSRGRAPS